MTVYGQPEPGQPGQGQPGYPPPEYGQPEYGQPGYGPPPEPGQPGYGPTDPGQPGYGPPVSGPPGYGPPEPGHPGYPPPEYGQPDFRVPSQEYPGWEQLPPPPPPARAGRLLVPLILGSLVAISLGVYASLHEATGIAVSVAGFSGPLQVKVWLASGALVFAVVQLLSSFVMYGKVPGITPPSWIGGVHRWSGRIAFVLAIPVAIHCLYAIGFLVDSPRALVHSLLGCLFFGAFVVKMLGLRKNGIPGWALPVLGGLVFTMLVGLWLTSSLWYFTTFGLQR
jgi:uncharacterized protein DUF6529